MARTTYRTKTKASLLTLRDGIQELLNDLPADAYQPQLPPRFTAAAQCAWRLARNIAADMPIED